LLKQESVVRTVTEKGIVSWDRIFYISAGLAGLGILTGFFSDTISFICWVLILALWSEIPGFINIHLNEINISEFIVVLLAIHFGGIPMGLLAAVYVAALPICSRMWKPAFAIKGAVATFIAISTSPLFYYYVFNQNLLWTLYTYTAILFITFGLFSLFLTTGAFFKDLRLCMISLPIAYLTNLIYVYALEDWVGGWFVPTPHFPGAYKLIIIAFMLAIGGVAIVNRKK
jgi:hypothetical protein